MKTLLALLLLSLVCRGETLMDRDSKPWSNGSRDWECYQMSARLRAEAGHPTCRIGASKPFACSWRRWNSLGRPGRWFAGHGYSRDDGVGLCSMEDSFYMDHRHLVHCWGGWNTSDRIKRGGWNGKTSFW